MSSSVAWQQFLSPLAGQPAAKEMLVNAAELEWEYFARRPNPDDFRELVRFREDGHSGSPLAGTFNEAHVLALTQAICDFRSSHSIDGPLYIGRDTHAPCACAQDTALEVLVANGLETILQKDRGPTPAPVISRAILVHNLDRIGNLADGIVLAPVHHVPEAGGLRYVPPNGGPADYGTARWIESRANSLLRRKNGGVKRLHLAQATRAESIHPADLIRPYVLDLETVIDMDAIRGARLRLGADSLGGASLSYWDAIASNYGLDVTLVSSKTDPAFAFMKVDHDGRIRMDCSSPYAMAGLIGSKDAFHVAFATDPDADLYGIVTPWMGLMKANEYLPVAIRYLLNSRPGWRAESSVGKTFVASSTIDLVTAKAGRQVWEVPSGFRWFTRSFLNGECCIATEESGAASLQRRDGGVWTTSQDGLAMSLLAAEITARTGRDPGELYQQLTNEFGTPYYTHMDLTATPEQKSRLSRISEDSVTNATLAGEAIMAKWTRASGSGARLHGLKVITSGGWFAVRPSGRDGFCRMYAESFESEGHLAAIVHEARDIVNRALQIASGVVSER